jgi:hypothetical protein
MGPGMHEMPFLTSLIKDVLYTMHTFQKSRIHEMPYLTLFCQKKSLKWPKFGTCTTITTYAQNAGNAI